MVDIAPFSSYPDLIRVSPRIAALMEPARDSRVKPGHDDEERNALLEKRPLIASAVREVGPIVGFIALRHGIYAFRGNHPGKRRSARVMVVFGSLTIETFRSEIGNMFWVDTVPEPVRIRLIRMKEGVPSLRDFRVPFSLIFASPRDTLLLEGTYDFKSESGREFRQIHMAPIQSAGPMQEYQVIHN